MLPAKACLTHAFAGTNYHTNTVILVQDMITISRQVNLGQIIKARSESGKETSLQKRVKLFQIL